MKKRVSIVVILMALLLAIIPVASVYASSGGLLAGKRFIDDSTGELANAYISDGYRSPGVTMGVGQTVSYTFLGTADLTSFMLSMENGYKIELYNASNEIIYTYELVKMVDQYVITGPWNGVKKIVIHNTRKNTNTLYDFDAFGTETITPNPPTDPVPDSDSDRAILTITMTNGFEKEYDLSMIQINAFLDWFDARAAGIGPAKYQFSKTWNKGPFKVRSEYVIFDKILTFDIDEYEEKTN